MSAGILYRGHLIHFGHKSVISYANRPYKNVHEMNEALIGNWNSVVNADDHIYHLGDVSFLPPWRTEQILSVLKGHKYLIFGNHDKELRKKPELLKHFIWAKDYHELTVQDPIYGKQLIVLMHYSMRVWNKSHYGSWQLYGHSHGSLEDLPYLKSMDVGVDCHDYHPISYESIRKHMESKVWKPVDHHGQRGELDE